MDGRKDDRKERMTIKFPLIHCYLSLNVFAFSFQKMENFPCDFFIWFISQSFYSNYQAIIKIEHVNMA